MKNIAKQVIHEIADEMPVLVQIQPLTVEARLEADFRRREFAILAVAYEVAENLRPVR